MDGHDQHPDQDQVCLGLGLGLGLHQEQSQKRDNNIRKNKCLLFLDLSMSGDHGINNSISNSKLDDGDDDKKKQGSSKNSDETSKLEKDTSGLFLSRKKLRLNRDQTALLEDSFREHSTLNTAQKMSLAEKLNLRPRQVEVWFQNRRARTKLKQTEIDCEFLKKKCEKLGEENRRLKKELFDLRSTLDVEKPMMQGPSNLFRQHISRN